MSSATESSLHRPPRREVVVAAAPWHHRRPRLLEVPDETSERFATTLLALATSADPTLAASVDEARDGIARIAPLAVPAPSWHGRAPDDAAPWTPRSDSAEGVHLRRPPFDGASSDGNPGVISVPDAATGQVTTMARSGHTDGGLDGKVFGATWLELAVSSPTRVQVRAAPYVRWLAEWRLGYSGIAAPFGTSPWATARGGVEVQAFDEDGAVGPATVREVMAPPPHQGRTGYPSWDEVHGTDDGIVADMNCWFEVPAGGTRWVDLFTYVEADTYANGVTNVAAAYAWIATTVQWVWIEIH